MLTREDQTREDRRKRRLALNTSSSLLYQLTTVISGFILPRLILQTFGSEVNGLVNSITQFLGIISFLDLGVGVVVQSALYGPLAEADDTKISQIVVSACKFFNMLAWVLLAYVIVLIIFYPFIAGQNFGWMYTATLIGAISISSFAQYYFGVVDRLLLTADQRGYVQFNAQTLTLIANTIACAIFIGFGSSIQVVKLTTSLIYLLRPAYLRLYVNKRYRINRKATYDTEPIGQKWNGVAQHLASVVLDGTDSIVLTLFSTLSNVSIYSVYNLVVYGIKQIFLTVTIGFRSLLGELWARQETEELKRTFGWFEWLFHSGVVMVFGCTGMLIVPFIMTYTAGVTDANYDQPIFGIMLTVANACHCLRLPYNAMILAAGKYKETQSNYIIAMVMNIIISVFVVQRTGLIGVTVGTFVAMVYQTIWMAWYDAHHLVKLPLRHFMRQFGVDAITVVVAVIASSFLNMNGAGYLAWAVLALKTMLVWIAVFIVVNYVFYRDKMVKVMAHLSGFMQAHAFR